MPSLQELLEQKSVVERAITKARQDGRALVVARILSDMAENGLTLEDLAKAAQHPKSVREGSRARVAAKYRDPESGATWSGRGLKPRWLVAALAGGKTPSDFAV
jgi:DNA-binding protein H-NS